MVRKFFVVGKDGENNDLAPVPGEVYQDEAGLEIGLLELFSELALLMEELREIKEREPVQTLKILSDSVNKVAVFAEQSLGGALPENYLRDNLLDASGSFSHLKLLHADRNRLSAQTAINLYAGWAGDAAGKNQAFQQISLGMVHVLESYLDLIAGFFGTPHIAVDWNEALKVYIDELKDLVKSVAYK